MKTILIPTDFSDTAANAAQYAAAFASAYGFTKIILYNTYEAPISADPAMPAVQLFDIDVLKKDSEEGLLKFKERTFANGFPDVEVETFSEFQNLNTGIEDICEARNVNLVIMGITGGGKVEEALIGSNTISVAKHSHVPVIIVPQEAKYNRVEEILLACDFKKVAETTPITPLKMLLDFTKAKLFVLHINANNKETDVNPEECKALDNLLLGYSPEFNFIHDNHFTDAINDFAYEKNVDMIVTIPKKHGFFEGLFHKSHTKQLAFHSHIPIMVLHD